MEADTVIDTLVGQAIGGSGGGLNGGNGSGTVSQMSAAGGGTQTGGAAFGAGAANGRRRRFLWWIWSLTVHGGGSGYIGGVPSFKHTNGKYIHLLQQRDKKQDMGKLKLHLYHCRIS